MTPKIREMVIYALVVIVALLALWVAASSPSFSMNNKAVYQGF